MTVKLSKAEKKVVYDKKLYALLDEYSKVLVAAADNVGSNQLRNIRKGLRGDSIVLMGKNTLIRRCIKIHSEKTGNKNYLNLLVVRFPPLLPEKLWLCTRYLFLLAFMTFYLWFVLFVRLREIVGLIFTKGEISRNLVRRLPSTSPEVLDLTEEDLIEKFAAGLSRDLCCCRSRAAAVPAEEKKEEPTEESDDDMGFWLVRLGCSSSMEKECFKASQTDGARPLPHRPKPYGSAPHNIGLDESACAVGSVRVNDLRDHIKLGIGAH
ncbi:hypothetical protein BHM03_00040401 [Ensete ventricosum]|nr:hypothetical protein BHM03_00040401 [Ensete ventricosum]